MKSAINITAPVIARARKASPAIDIPLDARRIRSLSRRRKRSRCQEDGAIRNASEMAVSAITTKKRARWKSVTLVNPCANGTASRNANSTCTPGSATRSSLSSSISSRLTPSLRSSSGSPPLSLPGSAIHLPFATSLHGLIRARLDVVHPRPGLLGLASGDVGDRGGAEGGAQRLHSLLPDAAGLLSFLAHDPVESLDDLEHVDLVGRLGERVAALGATVADQDSGAAQCREELLEELHRDTAALCDLADRQGVLPCASQ